MRNITISYDFDGPEETWAALVGTFVAAIDNDAELGGRFCYQVAVAADGRKRIHWGRWSDAETLKTLQSRAYFKTFTAGLKDLLGGTPQNVGADITFKTKGW